MSGSPLAPASAASNGSQLRLHFPPELPISARVSDIQAEISQHQVVIVAGATGSGKTTQLPKIVLQLGRGSERLIGVTQPRRLAATSVAARVASEVGCQLGHDVRAIASKCLGMYAQDSEQVAVVPACKKALIIDAEFPVLLEAALDSFE